MFIFDTREVFCIAPEPEVFGVLVDEEEADDVEVLDLAPPKVIFILET